MTNYIPTIGVEVHVELKTNTKIFSASTNGYGQMANSLTGPIDLGYPGTLPTVNKEVINLAIKAAKVLNCNIRREMHFDRKNYFYPDNPQNYQISQLYFPICQNGFVEIKTLFGMKKIGIHEIHMEEDAGKLIHNELENCSFIDYNRAGVPLIEIVSKPDMASYEEVIAYLEKLCMFVRYLGVSDCKLQEGSMRVDVNLSVKEMGQQELGVRTEMKNLNSFRAMKRAIEHETKRQITLLEEGKEVVQETRRWDDGKGVSYSMRSKEDAKDYRYFPEPDLVPIVIEEEWIEEIKSKQPEFQNEKIIRYKKQYNIPDYDIEILTTSKKMATIFEETVFLGAEPKKVSNWLMVEAMRLLREKEMDAEELTFSPKHLATLIELTEKKVISGTVAKEVFEKIFEENVNPNAYIEEHGLKTVHDESVIGEKVKEIIIKNAQSVTDYKNGKKRAIGFLVGQVMKEMKGKADPQVVTQLLETLLNE